MSTIKSNNHQIGQSATATNNATWYQPASPDGTVRLGVGNAGATTTDVITASSTGVTIPSISSNNTFGFKNRIINGGMVIDQRNAGASVSTGTGSTNGYSLDRWTYFKQSSSGSYTIQQSATAPVGFKNSTVITIASTVTETGTSVNALAQFIEGLNTFDLNWGSSSAVSVTVSFWVRSSITGTFSAAISNDGYDYSYVFNYTINAANTWEQKTITIPGPTSGTWVTTNAAGLRLWFDLGTGTSRNGSANAWTASQIYRTSGSVQLIANSGATWYVTGVQLEAGSQATSFDFRSYGQELALCQRYYYNSAGTSSLVFNGSSYNSYQFKVTMRASPTMTLTPDSGSLSSVNALADGFGALSSAATYVKVVASSEL